MAKVKDIIERLQTRDPEEEIAVSIWSADDVKNTSENDTNIILTDEQATAIIKEVDHYHDACVGINWDVIQCHIDMFLN
jgi:hypothetical protein